MNAVDRHFPGFPWGTLAVNMIGSLCAGAAWVLSRNRFPQYEMYFPILFAGFFGAFTTFSTFALESVRMLAHGEFLRAVCNILLQNFCGLAAAAAGFHLMRFLTAFRG